MLQSSRSSQTWEPDASKVAEKSYREANGAAAHERWIQEPITSRHSVVITRHYESVAGSIFVRPVQPPAVNAELAKWHALGASAFRAFEESLDDLD
jgi:hypothetical protein